MDTREFPESRERIWIIAVPPALWALHFLACYITAAIWCAKTPGAGIEPVRWAVLMYSIVTLAGILYMGRLGWKRHSTGINEPPPHLEDKPGDRHRFLGWATFLLAGISLIGTLFVAMVVVFIGDCR